MDRGGAGPETTSQFSKGELLEALERFGIDVVSRSPQPLSELRQRLHDALKDAEPVKELRQQVEGALKLLDEMGNLQQQMEGVRKDLDIQFQRIAQIQAQLDQLMGILVSPSAQKP